MTQAYHLDIAIDPEVCIGCGACVAECPMFALSLVDGAARFSKEKCGACGMCVDVCPENAIVY